MMKKILLLGLAAFAATCADAAVFVNDSFAYPTGTLNSQGSWVMNGTAGSNPILVTEESLVYEGYQNEVSGNAVVLDKELGKNSYQTIFAPAGNEAPASVYYSALVRIDEFQTSSRYGAIITLTGLNAYDRLIGDAIASSEGAGLYVKKGSADDKALFGVSIKGSSNGIGNDEIAWASKEVNIGETSLIAVRYETGDTGVKATLYVNPAVDTADADAESAGLEETLVEIRGISLNQRSSITSKNPQVLVDELRVASEWSELFAGEKSPVTVPNITISENPLDFGQLYTGVPSSRKVVIKGTDLTQDITLSPGESGFVALSTEVISKEAAMSEDGYELTVTVTPEESRYFSDKITFSSEGASDKILNVQWHPVPSLVAKTLRELCDEDTHDMVSVYVYTGEATVSFVESYYDLSYERVVNSIFIQDATGGAELRSATGCGYQEIDIEGIKVGDNLTNIAGYLIFGDNGLTFVPRTPNAWEVVSHDNEIKPICVTLREIAMAEDGYVYGNQLVQVSDVRFRDEYYLAGDYHGLWNSQKYQIFDGTLDDYDGMAWMWCNKGADYFKTSTEGYFNHYWTLTGIVNSYYPIHISPRSKLDFEDLGEREIKDPAGVDSIEADDAENEIFDLLGNRVAADTKGLVIVRSKNGTVSKQIRK